MTDTLGYLDPQGNVNFRLVAWSTLNQWLSRLNGNASVDVKLSVRLNRSDVIRELETRRKKETGLLEKVAGKIALKNLGEGIDWREYENAEGFTHLEELLIHQPEDWRKQAREYFFGYGCALTRESKSRSLRTCQFCQHDIFMETPVLMVLFHPHMNRVTRYEPLNFLLSYCSSNPLPRLLSDLRLDDDERQKFLLELSPLDYFFEFQRMASTYKTKMQQEIGNAVLVPRLPLLNELNFSKVIGQRLAKSMILQKITTYFWSRAGNEALALGPLSMIFAGPSGNGKTELAREVAELLNRPSDNAFHKVDCGVMTRAEEIFGLAGAYVGSHEGSALNNFVRSIAQERNKIGVVLLDEIDKAAENVITGLYQVLDKGEWTDKQLRSRGDSQSSIVPCNNIIFIMTVNAADHAIVRYTKNHEDLYAADPLGLLAHRKMLEAEIQHSLQATHPFTSAFIGRVNAFVPFLPMACETRDNHGSLLEYEMMTVAKMLLEREKDKIDLGGELLQMKQVLTSEVKHKMAKAIVRKAVPEAGVRSIQKGVHENMSQELMHRCLLVKGGISHGSTIDYDVDSTDGQFLFRMIGFGEVAVGPVPKSKEQEDRIEDSDLFG